MSSRHQDCWFKQEEDGGEEHGQDGGTRQQGHVGNEGNLVSV